MAANKQKAKPKVPGINQNGLQPQPQVVGYFISPLTANLFLNYLAEQKYRDVRQLIETLENSIPLFNPPKELIEIASMNGFSKADLVSQLTGQPTNQTKEPELESS